MPKTLTFRDFSWRSKHHIPALHGAAAQPHWHSYRARFWFTGALDQDWLVAQLERTFAPLNGAALNAIVQPDSKDETVAAWLLGEAQKIGTCVRVVLENDGQRGAEVEAELVNLPREADPYYGVGGSKPWDKDTAEAFEQFCKSRSR